MRSYTITVNGNVYDVTVEETTGTAPASTNVPGRMPASAPERTSPPTGKTAAAAAVGAVAITAGAAGKVVDIVASAGMSVSKGDPVVILEIMKMETPVVAPQDGTLASIHIEKGQSVVAGEVLATMD